MKQKKTSLYHSVYQPIPLPNYSKEVFHQPSQIQYSPGSIYQQESCMHSDLLSLPEIYQEMVFSTMHADININMKRLCCYSKNSHTSGAIYNGDPLTEDVKVSPIWDPKKTKFSKRLIFIFSPTKRTSRKTQVYKLPALLYQNQRA